VRGRIALDGLQRSQQQGQRRAQLVADIGEKAALDLVEFLEFLIAVLQRLFVFVQFVAEDKFTKRKRLKK